MPEARGAVHIRNRQRKWKVDAQRLTRLVARVVAEEIGPAAGEVTVVLLRDAPMARLNESYRGKVGPTDVLAFPSDPAGWPPDEPRPLGEVVVSVDRAAAQARERGLPRRAELERLVVHGALHLAGYRDDRAAQRARMRRREDLYLRRTKR